MTSPFRVTCDECTVTLHFVDGRFGFAVDLANPQAARRLGQELIDKAQDCEDANEQEWASEKAALFDRLKRLDRP